jgi:putative hydrolase of the HAD superfamily
MSVDAWLPRLQAVYRSHAPSLRPREGVCEALKGLVARGARLALVSDGYLEVQRRKWASLRLPFDFHPTVFTDERGREFWKPHPWSFELVMQAHPRASRFVYVGDNPVKDFIAPNRLGWTTVMVRDGRNLHSFAGAMGEASPTRTIDRLATLVELCRTG